MGPPFLQLGGISDVYETSTGPGAVGAQAASSGMGQRSPGAGEQRMHIAHVPDCSLTDALLSAGMLYPIGRRVSISGWKRTPRSARTAHMLGHAEPLIPRPATLGPWSSVCVLQVVEGIAVTVSSLAVPLTRYLIQTNAHDAAAAARGLTPARVCHPGQSRLKLRQRVAKGLHGLLRRVPRRITLDVRLAALRHGCDHVIFASP